MFAITKASLRAIFRSPSAVIFGFAFPLIFILVFGFIGDNGRTQTYKVAIEENADTTNALYKALVNTQGVSIIRYHDKDSLTDDMEKENWPELLIYKKILRVILPIILHLKVPTQVMINGRNLKHWLKV